MNRIGVQRQFMHLAFTRQDPRRTAGHYAAGHYKEWGEKEGGLNAFFHSVRLRLSRREVNCALRLLLAAIAALCAAVMFPFLAMLIFSLVSAERGFPR